MILLAILGRSVSCSTMRNMVVCLLAVMAMVFAGFHAPAIAFDGHDEHSAEMQVQHDAVQDHGDNDLRPDQSDGSSSLSHHHHCPVIALPRIGDDSECAQRQREVFAGSKAYPLGSLAPQPLIDPPSL